MNKIALYLLLMAAFNLSANAQQAKPVKHNHNGRTHTHVLPNNGVGKHNHNNVTLANPKQAGAVRHNHSGKIHTHVLPNNGLGNHNHISQTRAYTQQIPARSYTQSIPTSPTRGTTQLRRRLSNSQARLKALLARPQQGRTHPQFSAQIFQEMNLQTNLRAQIAKQEQTALATERFQKYTAERKLREQQQQRVRLSTQKRRLDAQKAMEARRKASQQAVVNIKKKPVVKKSTAKTNTRNYQLKSNRLSSNPSSNFNCSSKYCKNMVSCAEARYKFEYCGHSNLDRDNDGIPCENVCL